MSTFLQPAFVLSVILGTSEAMDIVKSAPNNTTMIREGESMWLTCNSDMPWFLCVWTSPQGEKQCAIQEESKTTSVCQGDPRVHLEGRPTSCTVMVPDVRRSDRGTWMCLLQDGDNFEPAQKLLEVEVATEGQIELAVRSKKLSGGVLRLTAGDEVDMECKVENAFPAPVFAWSGLEQERRVGREVGREEEEDLENIKIEQEVEFNQDSGTYSSISSFHYTARLADSNSSVICSVKQLDRQGNLLYSQETNITLEVVEPPPQLVTASSTSLSGLILGSSIGALLVLLLLILTAVYICKRKQKKREPSPPPPSQPVVWSTNLHQDEHNLAREAHLNSTFDSNSLPEYADVVSSSSSSDATVTSLSRLPTLPCLQETHFPSSSTFPHPPPVTVLSSRSLGCPSRNSMMGDDDMLTIPSRAASTLGVSLSPSHLFATSLSTSPTPPCPGSRASNRGSLFHCSHDCFNDEVDPGHHHQHHHPLPASRPLSPTFL